MWGHLPFTKKVEVVFQLHKKLGSSSNYKKNEVVFHFKLSKHYLIALVIFEVILKLFRVDGSEVEIRLAQSSWNWAWQNTNSAHAEGGPRYRVCARNTHCLAPHRHEWNFLRADVCWLVPKNYEVCLDQFFPHLRQLFILKPWNPNIFVS